MGSNLRITVLGCVLASLPWCPSLVSAGPFAADGQIGTVTDLPLEYWGGGWLSIAGQPPSPDPLGPAASTKPVEGDGANWEFGSLTLKATGGLGVADAKGVALELSTYLETKNEHVTAPHAAEKKNNELPPMTAFAAKGAIKLGDSETLSAFGKVAHRVGKHMDAYTIGGTVSYTAGGVIDSLATDNAWVRAKHDGDPVRGPQDPPGKFKYDSNVRFDADSGLLSIMAGHVTGGISHFDRLFGAMAHPLDFHFAGQNESGAWRFQGGHFGVDAPDIAIQGFVDELVIDPMGGIGTFRQGSAADGSQGASPWMNELFHILSGNAETGMPGLTYGNPAIQLDTFFDLAQMTNGFQYSIDWMPVQVSFGPSLVEAEQHVQPGDYNGDGRVDPLDHALWLSTFGEPGGPADGNGDGIVGPEDYTVWRDNLGAGAILTGAGQLASSSAAVPEPSAAVTLLIGLTALVAVYRPSRYRAK